MKLTDVLAGVGAEQLSGSRAALDVTGVAHDSRKVRPGDLFVALQGATHDGASFLAQAKASGAVAVLAEKAVVADLPVFKVTSARRALAEVAANVFRRPAAELMLLGITGTNGKTTTAYLLESICSAGGAAVGRIGTIDVRFAGRTQQSPHTTPDALALHRLFREMLDAGTDTVVMEVSSHALDQERVHGLTFRAAAFTNLSRDHLDYHADMEAYFQAKRKLFNDNLSPGGVAVVNGDDTYAARIYNEVRNARRMAWKFSRTGTGEISAAGVELGLSGIRATLKTPAGDIKVQSSLLGPHNLENILAAAGIALGAGFGRRDVQEGIERVKRVPGRMERVEENGRVALVDYAHSDDALRRALEASRALAKGRVIVVFGCGGDRDKGKRPLMGQVVGEGADLAVVTSDNPRSEDPAEIISQITPGLEKGGLRRISAGKARSGERGYLVDVDRRSALETAASLARPDDVILVAGKGHEAYQEVGTERLPFDDVAEARAALGKPGPA
ncbi:MAG: UDP-N-acetylmuramoyl-L-alanyl-D-glutamate--2,6-diaminopimelate ligase [Myxococcaceae bacterium]